ncbi:MAG: xanthine dehydrogenase accessory factor [Arcticibacterium sp.]|jgi:xanthine dehydrogenase accessory factor
MKEIRAILKAYHQKAETEKVALATVVRVEGSSYRRMGARMLVSENGTWVGGISGGCLEGDALKRARMAILKERSSIITYDTSTDDHHQIGVGLGCNGIIDVLFTPINDEDKANPMAVFEDINIGPRKNHKLITITASLDKKLLGQLIPIEKLSNYAPLKSHYESITKLEKSKNISLENDLSVFVEILPPALFLIFAGHQYDLPPLIRQTKELGWDYKIVATVEKTKDKNILSKEAFYTMPFDDFTAVILMSHSLKTDKENLQSLLSKSINYIGMLGPRVRAERIFKELEQEGHQILKELKECVYAPTGLDIGATNPEEIALSILAEIKTVFSKRSAQNLRDRQSPIHFRDQDKTFN